MVDDDTMTALRDLDAERVEVPSEREILLQAAMDERHRAQAAARRAARLAVLRERFYAVCGEVCNA
jgi:hypothetical protein